MTLVVFDLDGTLLNGESRLSEYTAETLILMQSAGIAYTIATGRTLQAALSPLDGHRFALPHILKNGVIIWCPDQEAYSHSHLLTQQEVSHVLTAMTDQEITPFVFTLESDGRHAVYHGTLKNEIEGRMAQLFEDERKLPLEPLSAMPDSSSVICLSAMGPDDSVQAVIEGVASEPGLVSYTGAAIQNQKLRWMDIHHSNGSKGDGVTTLREELGFDKVMVFGDGENDLSMFEVADESYAPANGQAAVKSKATEIIGHHNEDGVARFLRKRFSLGHL